MKNLHKGDVIEADGSRCYVVLRKLGEGQFAEVWEVRQDGAGSKHDARYALKLEKRKDRSTVKQEYKALKKLSGTCDQVVAVENFGMYDERFYMVLQLLGETLYDARKQMGGRFDLPTVKAVGLSTLSAIEQVHQQSMIHRDIKPANFVINPPNAAAGKGSWLLIDFGLARRYTDDSGAHLPPRADASFRGSTTYASVHAHRGEDLSRRDDLWSWLYMMAELLDGGLPWRPDKDEHNHTTDKQWVQQQKEAAVEQPNLLTRTVALPEPFAAISGHLKGLGFEDAPDYALLRSCLQRLPDHQLPLRDLAGFQATQLPNGQPGYWQLLGASDLWQAQQQHQQQADAAAQNGQAQALQSHQQEMLMTPASPPQVHVLPEAASGLQAPVPPPTAGSTGTTAAASNKRSLAAAMPAGVATSTEQLAKRQRPDSSINAAQRPASGHQQQRQGSTSLQAPAGDSPADDGRPSSRPGSSSAAAATAGGGSRASRPTEHAVSRHQQEQRRSRSRSRSRERQQQQRGRASRDGSHGEGGKPRQLQRDGSREKDIREPAAPAADSQKAASATRQQQQQQRPGGRQNEIADLLAAFSTEAPQDSREAAQKAVQGLCVLTPIEAVCAIGMTLDKLVQQSNPACRAAISQLLQDLAAYASAGAAKARQQAQQTMHHPSS